jgi:site-specific recombinase XerD
MRRLYVSSLLSAGVDVFTVQKLAGHADAVTTARYDRRGEGERRRAAAQLRIPAAMVP